MKKCSLSLINANPEACLYIDCDFYKERKCDFPYAGKGGMPIAGVDGAYHYSEGKLTSTFTLRLLRKRSTPIQAMFLMARALIDSAEREFIKHKSKEN